MIQSSTISASSTRNLRDSAWPVPKCLEIDRMKNWAHESLSSRLRSPSPT